jgi:hypothetical protein
VIQAVTKKASWTRRLSIALGLRQQEQKRTELGADVSALAYKTVESLGTEQRIQLQVDGDPFIEIYQNDKGYICVEVQGLETYDIRVRLSPRETQELVEQSSRCTLGEQFRHLEIS